MSGMVLLYSCKPLMQQRISGRMTGINWSERNMEGAQNKNNWDLSEYIGQLYRSRGLHYKDKMVITRQAHHYDIVIYIILYWI